MRSKVVTILIVLSVFLVMWAGVRAEPISSVAQAAPESFTFRRGVIVNHWLGDNLPERMMKNAHYGADWFDREDVSWIAEHGFDHLRIWVSGNEWVDASGHLIDEKIAPFERALRDARSEGLGVVLVMHGLPRYRAAIRGEPEPADAGSPFSDPDVRAEAENLWRLVAKRFVAHDGQLRFELTNQPDAKDARQMRNFNARMLAAVRGVDKQRMVYLGSRENDLAFIDDVVLPDANTALALTFREPGIFAYQYQDTIPVIRFPGKVPDLDGTLAKDDPWQRFSNTELSVEKLEAQVLDLARKARRAAAGREIYIHNIGVMTMRTDDDSVRTYMRTLRSGLEREGLSWAVYDYHTGCAVRADAGTGGPTEVLKGLNLAVSGQ